MRNASATFRATMDDLLLPLAAIVFGAGFVQGLSGFGFGLVAMSLLPALVDLKLAVPLVAGCALLVAGSLAWSLRRHVRVGAVVPLLAGTLLGIPLGVAGLASIDSTVLGAILGVVLVAYGVWALGRRTVTPRGAHPRWGVVAGFFGGVLGGAFNTSGPPVIAYVSLQDWSKDVTKATLQVYFVLTAACALTAFTVAGLVTAETLTANAAVTPALLAGSWAGSRLYSRVDQAMFRRMLLVGLLVMGAVYLLRALTAP
ncbi:MAG: sulfite exporter TauE/SafE family protein [Myxococcota bacterium]